MSQFKWLLGGEVQTLVLGVENVSALRVLHAFNSWYCLSTAVYAAEQTSGPNGIWHKTCLTCAECNKRLDSFLLVERAGEAYCKTCYNRKWGPKGFNQAGGTETKMPAEILAAANLQSGSSFGASAPPDQEATFSQPEAQTPPAPSSQQFQRTIPQSKPTQPPILPKRPKATNNMPSNVSTASSTNSFTTVPSPYNAKPKAYGGSAPISEADASSVRVNSNKTGDRYLSSISGTGYVPKKMNFQVATEKCAKCGKTVYAAEQVLAAGKKYHKLCLKCCRCNKLVDSSTMVDKDQDIYCSACYTKEYGPRGFRQAGNTKFTVS
ncbi:hypothetical protein BZG36_02941 [Bifiguratus adelaidae]|uniref:LIM zinc-binding domain-containing protein n=1 Tax=Bifiguratus adelaidae TaxID=1938954 RepID=A0A261Y051_9FUNG|nr:hypothetical protein BZG36_02941 [Bifiguratus adelaidae]